MKTEINILKNLFLLFGFLPLVLKFPYMLYSWQNSPLDRWDWLFLSIFVVIAILLWLPMESRRSEKCDFEAFWAAIPLFMLYVSSYFFDIHLLGILSAILFSWTFCWLIKGWSYAYGVFPLFGILLLSSTSTCYWLEYFFSVSGILLKIIGLLLFLVWLLMNFLTRTTVCKNSFCFYCVALVLIIFSATQLNTLQYRGEPFIPEFSSLQFGEFIGRKQEILESDRRFFGNSILEKYQFASDTATIGVLAVTCGNNVHQIHPASHCLRAGGWQIDSEKFREVVLKGEKLQINEIMVHNQHGSLLIWCWYSNYGFSTGSFFGFRRHWSKNTLWFTWQIAVPIIFTESESRIELEKFLNDAPQKISKYE